MSSWTEQINKHTVVLPNAITPEMNGKIPKYLMSPVFRGNGVSFGYLAKSAARSWNSIVRDAIAAGVPASSINATDAFRDYATQVRIFNERYTTTPTKYHDGRYHTKVWNGKTYYQKPHTATAAVPATSNHGKAVAVDKGDGEAFHKWLEVNAHKYGWEWELSSEKWHLHYWPGDHIPQAVLDSEKSKDAPIEEDEMSAEGEKTLLSRTQTFEQTRIVNGMYDFGKPGGDLNSVGLERNKQGGYDIKQRWFVGDDYHVATILKDVDSKTLKGPWLIVVNEDLTRLDFHIQMLKNMDVLWVTWNPNGPDPSAIQLPHGYHDVIQPSEDTD